VPAGLRGHHSPLVFWHDHVAGHVGLDRRLVRACVHRPLGETRAEHVLSIAAEVWHLCTNLAVLCEAVDHSEEPGITATFPETLAGSVAVGTCASPLHGLPQRLCLENGTWSDSILRNPCAGTCAAARVKNGRM